jgi:hypothetical protein
MENTYYLFDDAADHEADIAAGAQAALDRWPARQATMRAGS